jgi:mono/diheme cytochrome c family protein
MATKITWLACFTVAALLLIPPTISKSIAATQRSARLLYRQQCSKCHGPDGRAQTSKGKFSHARDLADTKWQDDVTDERIFNSIMNGRNVRGNMPSFGERFSEREINELVQFVRGLKQQ